MCNGILRNRRCCRWYAAKPFIAAEDKNKYLRELTLRQAPIVCFQTPLKTGYLQNRSSGDSPFNVHVPVPDAFNALVAVQRTLPLSQHHIP